MRYRMTLTVEDEGRPIEGSTVVEVSLGRSVGMPYAMGKRGEALVLDLGPRGLLFAVLRGANSDEGYWEMLPERIIAPALGVKPNVSRDDDDRLGVFKRLLAGPRGEKVEVPVDKLPMLVRFRDINDPKTVERIDPKNLAASLGPGVSLNRATVEITDDPVTDRIRQSLPWLSGTFPEKRLVPATGEPVARIPPAHLLAVADFISR